MTAREERRTLPDGETRVSPDLQGGRRRSSWGWTAGAHVLGAALIGALGLLIGRVVGRTVTDGIYLPLPQEATDVAMHWGGLTGMAFAALAAMGIAAARPHRRRTGELLAIVIFGGVAIAMVSVVISSLAVIMVTSMHGQMWRYETNVGPTMLIASGVAAWAATVAGGLYWWAVGRYVGS